MTESNPDAPAPRREFYDQTSHDVGDPADDLPLTVRVQGGQDRAVRYSADAMRAVRTTATDAYPWVIVAGPAAVGASLSDAEVRDWTVMPALFVSTPWAMEAARTASGQPGHGAQVHERGDLDVEAFRG